jgi:hypothetical protein
MRCSALPTSDGAAPRNFCVPGWRRRFESSLSASGCKVRVAIAAKVRASLLCPEYQKLCPGNDSREHRWRHLWLTNSDNLAAAGAGALNAMHQISVTTSKAWALKETAMCLGRFVQQGAPRAICSDGSARRCAPRSAPSRRSRAACRSTSAAYSM